MTAVVEARAVTKRWGELTALDEVTVDVPAGVTGLLGENGAGKTTLLGLVLGFHRPSSGALTVLGNDPATAGPAVRARIGYVPEHDALPPEARAQEQVRHVAELHGIPRKAAIVRAFDALNLVGLGEERLRPIGTMSTGQRQRVKIAQAIAHDPSLLLLDEPTNGLDPLQRDEMLALIRRIGHELAIDVVLSTHLLSEVEKVCDQAVVLAGGRVAGVSRLGEVTATGRFVVQLDGDPAALHARLAAAGLDVAMPDALGGLEVTLGDAAAFDVLRDGIADLGLALRRLAPLEQSLEQRFFEDAP